MKRSDPKLIFETGLQYHHYANTAYPLTTKSFKDYRVNNEVDYLNFLTKEFAKTEKLSLYVHIPFCKVRCKFCEYAVLDRSDADIEEQYVELLLREIKMYEKLLQGKTIVGYDMGGGTPTKLSYKNIERITSALLKSFNFDKNVVYSIETTPVIAAQDYKKIKAIHELGYERISMGIQTISEKLLNELGREGTTHIYEKATENIRNAGFKKFNIDLMYGFLHQNDDDFENTVRYAIGLNPEYITLYRNRYKGTKLEKEADGVSLYKIINQYRLAHKILNQSGYIANLGKNTFSKVENDYGTSDYLTKRVVEGVSYVGIGLGAQSFGDSYLSYNEGASNKKLLKYKQKIDNNQIPIQDLYSLDLDETIAKMVSVAFYFGFVDLLAFKKRFGVSFIDHFKTEVDYVLSNGLMDIIEDKIFLTARGSDYINGIIPLFYSERSKRELLRLFNGKSKHSDGEKQFLEVYNINEFERPSVATDIVILATDKQRDSSAKVRNLSVVLIKRAEHPFMNQWALPGGFVKTNETIENAALRELKQETGLSEIELSQLYTFSKPNRDPRGWIISCSFVALTDKKQLALLFGDDAIDAQLFEIMISKTIVDNDNNQIGKTEKCELKLTSKNNELTATLFKDLNKKSCGLEEKYRLVESNGIAFDHAKIIIIAIENQMQKTSLLFDKF